MTDQDDGGVICMIIKICACTVGQKVCQAGGRLKPGLALENVPLKFGLGVGSGRADTSRELLRAEEETMKNNREAQWLARVRGWAWSIKGGSLCDKQKSLPVQLVRD